MKEIRRYKSDWLSINPISAKFAVLRLEEEIN